MNAIIDVALVMSLGAIFLMSVWLATYPIKEFIQGTAKRLK